ncbi:glutamate receptor 2-like [Tubulanus polymorphus]|uniref:glutamate receptor 2-like n=1 Tax=Tubulanus polymorphus TaxID=672921 RepID=UPI003DA4BD01
MNPLGRGTLARVVTILEKPFVMLKENHQYMKGNDRYEGYLIDMLQEIADIIGFQYELYEVPDGKFGSKDDNGNWNGIVQELITGNATMSLATMSISVEREQTIDFTKPFEDLYITILLRRPQKENYLLQFLDPLHYLVWILILVALVATSVLMLIIDKLVPNNENDPDGPRYNLKESLWFFYGSLVQAGAETTPKTYSGRVLGSAWWFFSLILISSYTANLAAFLTVIKISSPIKEIPDLGNQNKIRYGTVKNSRTADFFKKSNSEILRKMWIQMSQVYPDSMVENSNAGIEKVLDENYAFLWDLPVNMYTATKLCDTMVVGGPFDRKHYGIGVPRGAAYRDDLTMAILKLNERGKLSTLKKKWWSTSKCGDPRAIESSSTTTELEIGNVAGVFIVLACGVTLALLISLLERAFLRLRRQRKRGKDGGKISPTKSSKLMKRTTSSDSENYVTDIYGNLIPHETTL